MRRTLLDNSSRWTLSCPNLNLVQEGALRGFETFSEKVFRHTTQLYRLLQYRNWSICYLLSWALCWAFLLPQHVGRNICRHIHILFQTCNSDTREDARTYMEFGSFCLKNFPLYCLIPLRFVVPRRQFVLPSNGMWEKTFILFVSGLRHYFQRLLCHDWNCTSLLWNIVHVPSTENTLPLSSQRRLSFLLTVTSFRTWSFEFSSSDQFEVLRLSSIVNSSASHVFEHFLDHYKTNSLKLSRIL